MIKAAKVPFFAAIFFVIFFSSGCSSGKKAQDPGFVGQTYHDITSRNNAYFNGNQKIKTIQKSIETSYQDNFDTILALRTNRDPELSKTYGSDLDEVVKKASAAIKRHEPSKWTDNAYLLVGKSYFLKGDYEAALETFIFVNTNFKQDELKEKQKEDQKKKKKKKKKKKSSKKKKKKKSSSKKKPAVKIGTGQPMPSSSAAAAAKKKEEEENKGALDFLKGMPVRPQAMVWMLDTYTQLEKYHEGDVVVTFVEADEKFPEKLKKEFQVSKANLAISRGNLESAIEPLTQAISLTKKKRHQARYHYILAQIYERTGQFPNSIENYKQVLKKRPKFDLEFNAKISIARIARRDQSLSSDEISGLLKKLLKDSKNKDFFDQVYYSLAEFALSRGNKQEALDYLKKSVESSTNNTLQKALSFNKIAEIYFDEPDYVSSQPYYDSTMTILPQDYADYEIVSKRNDVLKDLVTQLQVIEEQDSLLGIADMSESEREKWVDEVIRQKEKEREKNAPADDVNTDASDPVKNEKPKKEDVAANATASASGWYFYNTNAKSTGYNNFVRKWGTRKLEDNWRRNNKSSTGFDEEEELAEDSLGATVSLSDDNLDKEALLEAIPLTIEQKRQSEGQIVEALYKAGNIYRIDLKNNKKAIEAFEELQKRFPGRHYEAEVLYSLYILHADAGNAGKAADYRAQLIDKHPDSRYAKYLINPDLLETEKMKDKKLQEYYSNTYAMYLNNQIPEALESIRVSDSLFPNNNMQSKFALLKAQTIAKTHDIPQYLELLQKVVEKYPSTKERDAAEQTLLLLKAKEDSLYLMQINVSAYKYDVDAIHYFMVTYTTDSVITNDLMNAITAYNDLNRSMDALKMNSVALDDKNAFLVVKSFKNMKTSLNYYNAITSSDVFANFPPNSLEFCVISDVNFNKVITHSEFESYFKFFEARYVTNQ